MRNDIIPVPEQFQHSLPPILGSPGLTISAPGGGVPWKWTFGLFLELLPKSADPPAGRRRVDGAGRSVERFSTTFPGDRRGPSVSGSGLWKLEVDGRFDQGSYVIGPTYGLEYFSQHLEHGCVGSKDL